MRKPKRILFVQHGSEIMGGVERLLLRITESYRLNGIESIVALPETGILMGRLHENGVETILVPCNLFPGDNPKGQNEYLASILKRAKILADFIYERNIDLVHTNTAYPFDGALAARIAQVPHIWHIHSNFDKDSIPLFFRALPLSDISKGTLYAQLADTIVGCSKRTLLFFEQTNTPYLRVIQNGLDINAFDQLSASNKSNLREELHLDSKLPIIGFVGRISYQKDPLTFVNSAFEILKIRPDAHFVMVGPTDDKILYSKVISLISSHEKSSNFHILGEREDVPSLLPQLNLLLLTSKFEGLAGICLEALAAHCPVVSTLCGGSEEVIEDGFSGFLTQIGDYQVIAARALLILQNVSLSQSLKVNGRKTVEERFSWDNFIGNFISLYTELLEKHDPKVKNNLELELCFHLIASNADLALKIENQESRIKEIEGFFDRLQTTRTYNLLKSIYKLFGGKVRA